MAVCVGLLPTACASQPVPAAAPSQPVRIELGIYSGRADPAWDLPAAQADRLTTRLAALPKVQGTPTEGALGYHGFTISRPGGDSPGQASPSLVAFRGELAAPGTGTRELLADQARAVERWLLDSGRAILTATEVAEVAETWPHPPETWRADLAEMVRSKPTFTVFDVILDCADRSRAAWSG